MRTGLKTIYRKLDWLIKHPDRLFENKQSSKFPDKGRSGWKIKLQLYSLANELKEWRLDEKIGAFHCQPHSISIAVWKKLLRFNPNNLGNWSLAQQRSLDGTRRVEGELIKAMIDLYGGSAKSWEGYVTTGATESNIFSAWLGRNFLQKYCPAKQICLIESDLVHYSISKAADLIGIQAFRTKLNRKTWSIDLPSLETTLRKLHKRGYKGFLIPLTLGYTQTGTNDGYLAMVKLLKKLEEELKINTFKWIDAALNGLVLPFSRNDFFPLTNPNVNAICIDFHKAGMVPIPCGIVLYRKSLRKNIERPIPYIYENDNTLLGSRSGIPAAAAYFMITLLGKKGFRQVIKQGQQKKDQFRKTVGQLFPDVEIIDEPDGIAIGLISKRKLPKDFLSKYGLFTKKHTYDFSGGGEKLYIYKATFLYRE